MDDCAFCKMKYGDYFNYFGERIDCYTNGLSKEKVNVVINKTIDNNYKLYINDTNYFYIAFCPACGRELK